MFYIIRFILAWVIWLIFADKRRWREMIPVCMFGSFLDLILTITGHYFPYWEYSNPDLHPIMTSLLDDFDVYPVVIYLFIQRLPEERSLRRMFFYWFIWAGVAIILEYIHVKSGNMVHLNGWTFWKSYVADWFLYWLIYQFYKILKLEKLSAV